MIDQALTDAGFEIAHRFAVDAVVREPGLERLAGAPLGILIGSTRSLWPMFASRADRTLVDPLDAYTEQIIDQVIAPLLPPGARSYYAHRRYDGAFLPFQRLAVAAGLGALSPTQLVVHPVYGPWFGLRAVIVCDGSPPATRQVERVCARTCPSDHRCQTALAAAMVATGPENWRDWLAVRDACTVGREHRYPEDQIRYHYTKRF